METIMITTNELLTMFIVIGSIISLIFAGIGYHAGYKDGIKKRFEYRDFCDQCSGPFLTEEHPSNAWLEEGYGGHWDTCPNRTIGRYKK